MEILLALRKGEVSSVEELINRMKPHLNKSSKDYDNERSRLSYHIRPLKEEGLIEIEKSGKNTRLCLSQKGNILVGD